MAKTHHENRCMHGDEMAIELPGPACAALCGRAASAFALLPDYDPGLFCELLHLFRLQHRTPGR